MFESDDNFKLDEAELCQWLEHEEFEMPVTWSLEDFTDILHRCPALQEELS